MKNVIRLDTGYAEKSRVEYFLNKLPIPLEQTLFDRQELIGIDDAPECFKFKVEGSAAFVVVIFARSYAHALEMEAANVARRPDLRMTINGSILFGVESADADFVKEILTVFAGRE